VQSSRNRLVTWVLRYGLVAALALLAMASLQVASAQSLSLQLSTPSLTFADTSPLSKTDFPAKENPISATVSYSGSGVVHIFMIATGDMTPFDPAAKPIPASNVYWTAVGTGYEPGKISQVQEVEAARGMLSHDKADGWYFFLKHGIYDGGAYQLSITVVATVQ
jgi:hypothetical protein